MTGKSQGVFGQGGDIRVGLYARVSTHDQQTLPMQLSAMEDYATRRGWHIALRIEDIGSGASKRPLRDQVLAAARRRDIDIVLVWRLDRLGRSLKHLIELMNEMERAGIGFCSLQESINTTTSGGKLVFHIFGALAEFERELIRERTLAGLAAVFFSAGLLVLPAVFFSALGAGFATGVASGVTILSWALNKAFKKSLINLNTVFSFRVD